jgi:hypothetical protein
MNSLPSLTEIVIQHKTDKWGIHFYTRHYQRHLQHLRQQPINLLEIGVGGYESPHEEDRITLFRGSQIDPIFLEKAVSSIGEIDVIIDDGSHINDHIIQTFKMLFPLETEWNPCGGGHPNLLLEFLWGDSYDLKNPKTAMNFFKGLTDSLNFEEIDRPSNRPTYFDRNTVGLSFYHNMVFIQKGLNNEKSNWVRNNRMRSKN